MLPPLLNAPPGGGSPLEGGPPAKTLAFGRSSEPTDLERARARPKAPGGAKALLLFPSAALLLFDTVHAEAST